MTATTMYREMGMTFWLEQAEDGVGWSRAVTRVLSLVTLILALLAAPLAVEAQPARGVHRIGFLGNSTATLEANLVGPFREGLRELGYVEGQNSSSSIDGQRGSTNGFPPSSRSCSPEGRGDRDRRDTRLPRVKKATTRCPRHGGRRRPRGNGSRRQPGRPGGNITGLTSHGRGAGGKTAGAVREVLPNLARRRDLQFAECELVRRRRRRCGPQLRCLAIKVLWLECVPRTSSRTHSPPSRERPGALLVLGDRLSSTTERLMDFAAKHRLPGVYAYRRIGRGGRAHVLWPKLCGHAQARRLLCGQDPQGRQARRPAGGATDDVRLSHQPEDRQGPRPHDPAGGAGAGG